MAMSNTLSIVKLTKLNHYAHLKILGQYIYTFVIGHKSCNRLSILNKLTLQKELQNV